MKTRLWDRDDTLYNRYYNSDLGCVWVQVQVQARASWEGCDVDLAALRGQEEDKETRTQANKQGRRVADKAASMIRYAPAEM